MKYHISVVFPDDHSQDPGYDIEVLTTAGFKEIFDELLNDYGIPLGVGVKLIIERIG